MPGFDDDDEEEVLPECVTNYMFVDESEEPICFSVLPFQWEGGNSPQEFEKQVFLRGDGDDGLQKIYKQVVAWKVELQGYCPIVFVLSKDNKWIKLLKAKKSFEVVIRKVLITLQCLHFIRKDPETSEKALWGSVRKVFSNYEVRPSRLDLQDHAAFVREMAQKDEQLGKSQLLFDLLDARKKVIARNEDLVNSQIDFINDDADDEEAGENNGESDAEEDDEEDDGYDSVCCICDNGGNILCCDGRCMRSFHAVKGDGRDSDCATLGLSRKEVEVAQIFKCPNCRFERHQCFVCGKLGSSAESSREVFPCVNATCGHFYHPRCVAKLLHPDSKMAIMEEEKKIAAGHPFACPYHKCLVCRGIENKEVHELQFAMCRRCPRSYHRKCLPREISFDEDSDDEDVIQRAWDDLLPNRILIYCLNHEIDDELGTPIRNHLAFPEDPEKKKLVSLPPRKTNIIRERGTAGSKEKEPKVSSEKVLALADRTKNVKASITSKKQVVSSNGIGSIAKGETSKLATAKAKGPTDSVKLSRKVVTAAAVDRAIDYVKDLSTLPKKIDPDTVKRIETLVLRSSASLLTLDDFIDKKEKITTHLFSGKHVDKTITLGKVKGSIEAVQTALKQVEEDDGKTENAKAVCEPKVLHQIMTWKNKLSVYLGPFVHGLLYTSFGRHFTKVEKLEEIVDRLHWYVKGGDMIVDFCCGSNDFSLILKKKLEDTGKKCDYRNFDIIPPKNDFNFLKRDWMKVRHKDLNNVNGNKLIMGLNPPFGLKASLANKFIDKALEFRPKLLILIVPKETQRLDEKKNISVSYDLVWEDDKELSGKAFYLPGSVDDNDKQVEDWNVDPPPLYLWSRSDFTGKHKEIAREHGHMFGNMNSSDVGKGTGVTRKPSEKDDGSERKDRNDCEVIRSDISRSPRDTNDIIPKSVSLIPNRQNNNNTKMKRKAEAQDGTSVKPEGRDSPSVKKMKKPGVTSLDAREEELSDMSISPSRSPQKHNVIEKHQAVSSYEAAPAASRRSAEYAMLTDEILPVSRSTPDYGATVGSDLLKDNTERSPHLSSEDIALSTGSLVGNTHFRDPVYAKPTDLSRYGGLDVYRQEPRPHSPSSLHGPHYPNYLQSQGSLGLGREGQQSHVRTFAQQDRLDSLASKYAVGGTTQQNHLDLLASKYSGGAGQKDHLDLLASKYSGGTGQKDHLDLLASKYSVGGIGQKDHLDSLASKYSVGGIGQKDHLDSLASKYSVGGIGQKDHLDSLASKYSGGTGQKDHLDSLASKYSIGGTSGLGQTVGLGQTSSLSVIDKYTVGLNSGYTQRSAADRPSVNGTPAPGSYGQPDLRGYSHGPRYPLDGSNSAGWLND